VRHDSLALVRSFAAQIDAIITKVKAETAEDPAVDVDFEKKGQEVTRRQVLRKLSQGPTADGEPAPSDSPPEAGRPRKLNKSLAEAVRADLRLNQHGGCVARLSHSVPVTRLPVRRATFYKFKSEWLADVHRSRSHADPERSVQPRGLHPGRDRKPRGALRDWHRA
jgi:hypothetical protein